MGSVRAQCKIFLQIVFHTQVCIQISTNRYDFVLGTFKYTEANRKIYRKCLQYSTTHHVWFSDYFTCSIIICRSNFYSWHWLHKHCLCSSHTKFLQSSQMNLDFFSLIWDKCSISCSVLNDAGWYLELVMVPVKFRKCEWRVLHLALFAALRISDEHVGWSKQGPVPSRIFVASLSYVLQSCAHFQWK